MYRAIVSSVLTSLVSAEASCEIGQYWDSASPPDYIADNCATFRDLNPEFRHRLFSQADTETFIESQFGRRELAAFRACAVPSMQSDYFRYCFTFAFGGVYADADYRCLGQLRSLLDGLEQGEIFLGPTEHEVNGRTTKLVWSGLLAFRQPSHPLTRLALDIATANMEARIPERVWAVGENVVQGVWLTVGPGVLSLTLLMREWGSFDAFLEGIAGTLAEPFGPLYCEVVGDFERIGDAFEGVRVSGFESLSRWVAHASYLPYKATGSHWHNFSGSIFR